MSITVDIQSLSPGAIVEMFLLDSSGLPDGGVIGFHAGTNGLAQPLVWQGVSYYPLPVEAEGFDKSAKGALPRPKLRVANISGLFSAAIRENDDLLGARLIRKRTFLRYLDPENFPGGVNPDADFNQHLQDDVWFVDMKVSENRYIIEWELASAFDLQGVRLPYREVIQNCCTWRYRGPECGYTGTNYFDSADLPCVAGQDFCAKRLRSCRLRHPSGVIPFGGFPGATRIG